MQYTPGTRTTHGLTSATITIKARAPEPPVGPSPQPAPTAANAPVSAKMQTPANGSPNDERSTTLLPLTTYPRRRAAATRPARAGSSRSARCDNCCALPSATAQLRASPQLLYRLHARFRSCGGVPAATILPAQGIHSTSRQTAPAADPTP